MAYALRRAGLVLRQSKATTYILNNLLREGLINSKFQTTISQILYVLCTGYSKSGIIQTFLGHYHVTLRI